MTPLPAIRHAESIAELPAEEALFLGAAVAHIVLYRERQRLARIEQQNRLALQAYDRPDCPDCDLPARAHLGRGRWLCSVCERPFQRRAA